MHHHQKLHSSKVAKHRKTIQYQEITGDHFQKSHAIAARKHDIMQEIDHNKHLTPELDNSNYRWDSPIPRPKRRHQPPISLTQTGSFWAHAQPSVTPEKSCIKNPNL